MDDLQDGTLSHLRVLLLEPDAGLLARKTEALTTSEYSVIAAVSRHEVFSLDRTAGVCLAILSDSIGAIALRTVAAYVRKEWPSARILILRSVQSTLEDHFYDEMLDHQITQKDLSAALAVLLEDPWRQRLPKPADVYREAPRQQSARIPVQPSIPSGSNPAVLPLRRTAPHINTRDRLTEAVKRRSA